MFAFQLLGHVDTKSVSEHDNEGDTYQDDDSDKEGDTDYEANDSDNDSGKEGDTDEEATDAGDDSEAEEDDQEEMEKAEGGVDSVNAAANPETDDKADVKKESSSCTLSQPSEGSHRTEHDKRRHLLVMWVLCEKNEEGKMGRSKWFHLKSWNGISICIQNYDI